MIVASLAEWLTPCLRGAFDDVHGEQYCAGIWEVVARGSTPVAHCASLYQNIGGDGGDPCVSHRTSQLFFDNL